MRPDRTRPASTGSPDWAAGCAACCCAAQNLLLAAHGEGLVTKWSTGSLATMPPALEYFGLEEHDRIVGYIYLGYPPEGAEPVTATRAPATVNWQGFEG